MKLVLMSPDMNLGWVMMSLNTGMLWLTPGRGKRRGGGRRRSVIAKEGDGVAMIEQDRAWEGHELRRRAYTPHLHIHHSYSNL